MAEQPDFETPNAANANRETSEARPTDNNSTQSPNPDATPLPVEPPTPENVLPDDPNDNRPWYQMLNRYHWFVLIVAALGWLFDTMDQQLFTLARVPAMQELLRPSPGVSASENDIKVYGGYATAIFLMGWSIGGLGFGVLGDRLGRVWTMLLTILVYSIFTGLSALSVGFWDFALYRFLTGLGVGGEFAVGVALVAEVVPARARPYALGFLQALSAVGNVAAGLIGVTLGIAESNGLSSDFSWRIMFVIGTVPAFLALFVRGRLKEPERWQYAVTQDSPYKPGSYAELFGDPRWRKNAIIGFLLSFSGVIGVWGIGFFSVDLVRLVLSRSYRQEYRQQGEAEKDLEYLRLIINNPEVGLDFANRIKPNQLLARVEKSNDLEQILIAYQKIVSDKNPITPAAVAEQSVNLNLKALEVPPEVKARRLELLQQTGSEPVDVKATLTEHVQRIESRQRSLGGSLSIWAGITMVMQNIGAFFGIYLFGPVSQTLGRRPAFAICYCLAASTTILFFLFMDSVDDIFWMTPLMGFSLLSLFGGYAIYFPELFPTRLRSTGTSFCYNVGRFVAAVGPSALGLLSGRVFADYDEPMRYAGVTMCVVYIIGLCALPWAPETRNQPLPE